MVLSNTFATDTRVRREARGLSLKGFDVEILCWDRQGRRPSIEEVDGTLVRNMRLGRTTILATSRVHYLIAALLLQAIVFLWVIRKIGTVRTLFLHAHDFNTLLGSAAARWVAKNRVRLVYDCHELTPGVYKEWYGPVVSRVVERIEFALLHGVDAVVAANDAILGHLRQKTAVPAVSVYNCVSAYEIPEVSPTEAKRRLGLSGFFVILFAGRLRQDYDLDMILEVAREMKRRGLSYFKFLFTGPPETVRYLANAARVDRLQDLFDFRGWVRDETVLWHYIASDLCFAVTRSIGPNSDILTPVKLFESMACGLPVAVRERTLAAEIVRQWGCGIAVSSSHFLDQLLRLSKNPDLLRVLGAAGREAFKSKYNWERMQARLFWLYGELESSWV